jgi:CHAD domain-containing protein
MDDVVEAAGGDGAVALPALDVPTLSRRSGSGDVVRRALALSTSRLIIHDPVVRRGEDVEGVHQARVATRRLRSDLRTFAPLIDAAWSQQLRTELAALAAELGAVRDADVLLARLRADAQQLAEADRPHLARIFDQLEARRTSARRTLLATMSSPGYATLLDDLVDATQHPMLTETARRAARHELRRVAARPWKRLARTVAALPDEPTDADLHQVRIMAKRARYAAEAVVPVLSAASPMARALAAVQTVLGEHHDAVVAEQWLRSTTTRSRQEAFAVGALAGVQRAAAIAARARWRTAWAAAARPRLRAWM